MKSKLLLIAFPILIAIFSSCGNSPGTMDDIKWIVGHWKGTDVNDLVFAENWEFEDARNYSGSGFTMNPDGDTIFRETFRIELVEGVPYYVATVPPQKGPILFKMIQGDAQNAIFENKEHDFPKRISYILESKNTCKIKLEGVVKGVPKIETLTYQRVENNPLNRNVNSDSVKKDTAPATINLNL
jgi:hypothetical protein